MTSTDLLPPKFDFPHYRGDKLTIVLRAWADEAKTVPVNFEGAAIRAQARSKPTATDLVTEFDIQVTDNVVVLVALPSVVSTFPRKVYWDCQVDWRVDGVDIQTIGRGGIDITDDVTRP